jgi:hypothetical protein
MKLGGVRILSLILMGLASSTVHADRAGYRGKVSLLAETSELRAEHSHDWSVASVSATKDLFGAENTYSYLQLSDKATGTVLFRVPVPALTYIWISPDSKYLVGLSKIKLGNPYQIVVYSRSGQRLFTCGLVGENFPGEAESVTNWVIWYKEPEPQIEMIENGSDVTLTVENPVGSSDQFQFSTAK